MCSYESLTGVSVNLCMYEKWILLFSPCKTFFWCRTSLVSVFFTRNLLSSWNRLLDRMWVLVILLWRVISNCVSPEKEEREELNTAYRRARHRGAAYNLGSKAPAAIRRWAGQQPSSWWPPEMGQPRWLLLHPLRAAQLTLSSLPLGLRL